MSHTDYITKTINQIRMTNIKYFKNKSEAGDYFKKANIRVLCHTVYKTNSYSVINSL